MADLNFGGSALVVEMIIPSGGVSVSGCAIDLILIPYPVKFDLGEVAYVKEVAENCCFLEPVAIKKIEVRTGNAPGEKCDNFHNVLYTDTFNRCHNEIDLLKAIDAETIVADCIELKNNLRITQIDNLCKKCYD